MKRKGLQGFTLIELAMVTLIIGFLLGGILVSISASEEKRRTEETQKLLALATDGLYGFAAVNGRLPCPATAGSGGRESFCTNSAGACTPTTTPQAHGRCEAQFTGFLPAITLGLSPTDNTGILVDAWANRVRYALTNGNAFAFSQPPSPSGIQSIWRTDPTTLSPDLRVCSRNDNVTNPGTATADCPAADRLAENAVAVLVSVGANGAAAPAGADEVANRNDDRVFIQRTPTPTFDDLVVWVPPSILYNRLMTAGRLP